MVKTNAIRILEKSHIEYLVREYSIDESDLSAAYVARKTGVNIEQTVKTVVVKGDKTGVFVCLLQGHREIDFKIITKFLPDHSLTTVNRDRLLSITGYVRGGVSPFGMTKKYPMFLDLRITEQEWISCSAGKRGIQLWMRSADLVTLTSSTVVDLSKPLST